MISSSVLSPLMMVSLCITARYRGRCCVNQGCCRISGRVIRLSGSTSSMRGIRSRAPGERWLGRL